MIGIGVNILPFISKVARAVADYYNRVIADSGVSESLDCVNTEMSNINGINLLDQASLVMIPSGYKEDVVYSQIPTSGAGDLSFTRASNGTRINSAGLVEVVPWNFIQYSEDFSNAAYTNIRMNVTTNAVANPINGTVNADKLMPANDNGIHALRQTVTRQTVFIYAKKGENDQIAFRDDGNTGNYASFNLTSGTIVDFSNSGGTQSITSVGNGWYLCQITFAIQGEYLLGVYFLSNSYTSGSPTSNTYAGNGTDGLYAWGYQANIGSTAKPYFPTTDRLNVPRLTYQNGGGGCPSLLLEKQSTNLALWSEDFSNASWSKSTLSVTANASTAPDGATTADLIYPSANSSNSVIFNGISVSTSTVYTNSIYVKASGKTWVFVRGINDAQGVFFDVGNGVIGTIQGGVSGTITSVGSGWYRCTVTQTSTSTLGRIVVLVVDENSSTSVTASGTNGLLIWGAQIEASSYPTSYIPTTSSSATRVADACLKTGISSLIGQTEGVLFVEVDYTTLSGLSMFLSIRPNSSNKIEVYRDGGTIYGETTGSTSFAFSAVKPIGTHKIAFAYKSGDSALYIDGVLIGQNTTAFTYSATLADLYINQRGSGGAFVEANNYKEVILFPTRLTNAELASLTTI